MVIVDEADVELAITIEELLEDQDENTELDGLKATAETAIVDSALKNRVPDG
jgi:hypothetical protein